MAFRVLRKQLQRVDRSARTRVALRNPFHLVGQTFAMTVMALGLCACSHLTTRETETTDTSFKPFVPANALRIQPRTNQSVVIGEPLVQPPPVYPPRMITKHIPRRVVCLAISINPKGVVYRSSPLYGLSGCPANAAAVESDFTNAARRAVAQWRFPPPIMCSYPKGVDVPTRSKHCAGSGATKTPIPLRLAFMFTFTQTRGVTAVHTDRLTR